MTSKVSFYEQQNYSTEYRKTLNFLKFHKHQTTHGAYVILRKYALHIGLQIPTHRRKFYESLCKTIQEDFDTFAKWLKTQKKILRTNRKHQEHNNTDFSELAYSGVTEDF